MNLQKYLMTTTLLISVNAIAQQCPTPPTAIDIGVQSNYQYDNKTKDYTYTYKISNGLKAKVGIYTFKVESEQDVIPVQIPTRWRIRFDPAETNYPSVFNFSAGVVEINPGSKPVEFKIKSKQGPGITRYYAEGSPSGQLQAITVNGDSEVAPSCPGFFLEEASTFRQMITGSTIGPVPASQVEAKLKMKVLRDHPRKGCDDEEDAPELSPSDEGMIELIVHDAAGIDLGTVDLKSITFGPYQTLPSYAEVLESKNRSKVRHWRKKHGGDKKILFMKFKLSDLKVRCDLDKGLIFSAKAGDKTLVGATRIKSIMCNDKLMKAHVKRLKQDPKNYRQVETAH